MSTNAVGKALGTGVVIEAVESMTGAESMISSSMIAKRRCTFAPVTSSKRSAPAGLNVSET